MAPSATNGLEREDHARDAAFNKAMHGKSAQARGGIAAMFSKGGDAKQAAVDEYFKHWDNKPAENETAEERAVSAIACLVPRLAQQPQIHDETKY